MWWTSVRVGLFIIATLAILATGIFLIGSKDFLFTRTYPLKATFQTVAGLGNGAEVRVGGIRKGTVKQIQLPTSSNGGVTVVMDMERSTRKVIKKDSVATIEAEGLVGNKYVDVSFGSANAPPVDDWTTIGSAPSVDISDLVKKTGAVLDAAQESVGHMQETTDHLKQITSKIDQGQGTLGALVNDKSAYRQIEAATAEAKAGAAAFQENMQALKSNWFLRGFFRQRGYEDATQLTAHAVGALPREPYIKRFTYDAKTLFDRRDTAKLTNERTLNDAGRYLEGGNFGLAVVAARTDMRGDSNEARTLTQARAMVVRDYLVNHFGMDDTRLKTIGLGKSEGSAEEGTIEVLVYPTTRALTPVRTSGTTTPSDGAKPAGQKRAAVPTR